MSLCHFYKIVNKHTAPYLADLLPKQNIKPLKILQSIDVDLKNLKSLSFLQQFAYGTLLILMLEIQLPRLILKLK
jgi:hypothetical protein